uniref:Photosystem II reaction center protein T n=1 Tax=Cuscuta carnosa TaxID=1197927 RepID=A0A4Y6GT89_9ASTE|nr:photosystem II protein T [Cuscuta carnosa]QDF46400.1 photosystem II protein T [Cuscuta carnosa]
MEAVVYTFLLASTLGIIFFAIFFREPPTVPIKNIK